MQIPSIQDLLEAGVHFGHQEKRWNPRMRNYIFMSRNGIHIIDLKKTQKNLEDAINMVSRVVAGGKDVLFVATKKQGRESVKEHAERSGMFYMTERWLGGTLTNHSTIFKSIRRLEELEDMEKKGWPKGFKKREILQKTREMERINKYLSGIRHMKGLPGVIVVVDLKKEAIAVREARTLGIPCVGMVDTNCDPGEVDYPIPSNDDAIKSIDLVVGSLADAALLGAEGRKRHDVDEPERKPAKASASEVRTKAAPEKKQEAEKAAAPAEADEPRSKEGEEE
jgi:small subunit ribosomal protein S2